MSTGLKVFLWIAGILAVLLALGAGFGFYLASRSQAVIEEGASFAQNTDKDGCLTESATRLQVCGNASCAISTSIFAMACLHAAAGNADEICDHDTPSAQAERYCTADAEDYCVAILQAMIGEYCSDPNAAPPADWDGRAN